MKINDIPTDQWYQIFLDYMNGVHKDLRSDGNIAHCFDDWSTENNITPSWLDISTLENQYDMESDVFGGEVYHHHLELVVLSFQKYPISLTSTLNDMVYDNQDKPLSQKAKEYMDAYQLANPQVKHISDGFHMIYNDVAYGDKFILAINTLNDGKSLKDHPEQYHLFVQDTNLDRFVKISP